MNLKQLTYIITLEEEGNASNAARKLGVSQSTLSKYLIGLEDSLGVPLFIRTQKQLTATSYGRIYIDAAKRILQVYGFASQTISDMAGPRKTDLYLGLPAYTDASLTACLVSGLHRDFPHVVPHIKSGGTQSILSQLREGNPSLALLETAGEREPDLQYIPVWADELILAMPSISPCLNSGVLPDDRPEGLECMDIGLTKNISFILPCRATATRTIADSLFAARHMAPSVACETDDPAARLQLVKQGAGCTLVPFSHMLPDPGITYFHLTERYAVQTFIAFPRDREAPPVLRRCAEILTQYYESRNGLSGGIYGYPILLLHGHDCAGTQPVKGCTASVHHPVRPKPAAGQDGT